MEAEDISVEGTLFGVAAWFAGVGLYLVALLGVGTWVAYVASVLAGASYGSSSLVAVILLGFLLASGVTLCLTAIAAIIVGAIAILGRSSEFGVLGMIACVIIWVTFFPVMVVIGFFVGAAFFIEHWKQLKRA